MTKKQPEPLKQTGLHRSLTVTTHNRVLNETSQGATVLAERWGCTKLEVYRWLISMALRGEVIPAEAKDRDKS